MRITKLWLVGAWLVGASVFVFLPLAFATNPTYDLPDSTVTYSLLDGPESKAGAIQSVDLAGQWTFTPVGGTATTLAVPGGGFTTQGFYWAPGHTGCLQLTEGTYENTSVTVPNSGQSQVTEIVFGAINHKATLSVNGTAVGTNTTSFTPSVFDITNYVTPGNSYDIKVDVTSAAGTSSNQVDNCNSSPQQPYLVPDPSQLVTPQGIFRSAFIRTYPLVYINNVAIRPSVANTDLNYVVSITNASASSQNVTLSGNLTAWNTGANWTYPTISNVNVTIPAHTTQPVSVGPISWNLGSASYWWPNIPYVSGYQAQLHNLNLTVTAGSITDSGTYRFGFREVTQSGTNYKLNGVQVNFRGDSLVGLDYFIGYVTGHAERIDSTDTFAGMIPPAGTSLGWPQAVDNYEHLNYNIVRFHEEMASPYMLNVADEKGLMVLDETAIYCSGNAIDLINGHDNMVAHATALATRDRNHPSVVRWSQSNEAGICSANNTTTDSQQFETDLYNAINGADGNGTGTRPVSIDGVNPAAKQYQNWTLPGNLSIFPHYVNGGTDFNEHGYTDQLLTSTTIPFGQGEFNNMGSFPEGFSWFGTATAEMRYQNAADIRPYLLINGWSGVIPGLTTTLMGGSANVLYGSDTLTNPWSNSQIQLVQRGFNPMLVMDKAYWDFNKYSDYLGDWPTSQVQPTLAYNSSVTRTLTVFNDTFSSTAVTVTWQTTLNSPTGTVTASGSQNLSVPLGGHSNTNIQFTAPSSGSTLYLTVTAAPTGGSTVFSDSTEYFNLGSTVPQLYRTAPLDDNNGFRDGQVYPTYSGSGGSHWTAVYGSNTFGGTWVYTNATNDTATVIWNGNGARFFGVTDYNRGLVGITVDGGTETLVDEYTATGVRDNMLWQSGTLTPGQHTIVIRCTGQTNHTGTYVTIDRLDLSSNYP